MSIGIVLFLPAGRFDWAAGWIWLGVTLVGLLIVRQFVVRAHPDLPARRRRVGAGTPGWDRRILAVFRVAVLVTIVVASLDAGRFAGSSLPTVLGVLGLGLLVGGLTLFGMSVVHNRFFESTVRIQSDLDHSVVNAGPYRVIRHPGYAGLMSIVIGTPLTLGSAWALLPAGVAAASLILRTSREDEYLRDHLAGYSAYAATTRCRLIPWIW